jgi:hypothetical protein
MRERASHQQIGSHLVSRLEKPFTGRAVAIRHGVQFGFNGVLFQDLRHRRRFVIFPSDRHHMARRPVDIRRPDKDRAFAIEQRRMNALMLVLALMIDRARYYNGVGSTTVIGDELRGVALNINPVRGNAAPAQTSHRQWLSTGRPNFPARREARLHGWR